MKRKIQINKMACKGCGLCVAACPMKALTMSKEFNPAGYNFTVVDENTCVGCGTCYTVCPDYVYTVVEE